ncbi:hypothetical protein [Microbulbifer yueqingensis]|uniref:Uncharacterized protein n=1 Tax=Microbulbifer yueqingensis TaxID=658219 RepID=A0A1G9ACZ4_9GAMM|nr:hypothetical protein [Microbulbifer yueqingensis]SDK25229.1 hypothetical protein SAMN05216212_1956 [Microbulbifer yueqingensis]
MNRIILVSVLMLACGLTHGSNMQTAAVKIVAVENWTSGDGLYIKTDEASLVNPFDCRYEDKYHMAGGASDISKSMVLTAYASGKPVIFTIIGSQCSADRPQIVMVKLK